MTDLTKIKQDAVEAKFVFDDKEPIDGIVRTLADHVLTLADEVEKLRAAKDKAVEQRNYYLVQLFELKPDENVRRILDDLLFSNDQELERILKGEK